jgi:hypothetical protein
MSNKMKYAGLSKKQVDAADALAQQIVAQLKAYGSLFVTVDDGFYYVWYDETFLIDIADQATYKSFLLGNDYLKPKTKHVGLVMQRIDFWSCFDSQRFETIDWRIDGLGVLRVPYFNRRRPTKRTYDRVKRILQDGYYTLKGNTND